MSHSRNRRWAAIAADMREHHLVGMQVPPPKPSDTSRHAQPPFVAWADIIMSAAYTEHKVRAAGRAITLQRGEFLASRAYWGSRWNWGEQAVRGFFARLERDEMIALCNQPGNQSVSIAMVCNYDTFQRVEGIKQPSRQPRSNQGRASHCNQPDNRAASAARVCNDGVFESVNGGKQPDWQPGSNQREQPHTTILPRRKRVARTRAGEADAAETTSERSTLDMALADFNRAAESAREQADRSTWLGCAPDTKLAEDCS